MNKLIQQLQETNWDFSDYNSTKYPLDLNSIPWYPATFIPPIPKFLIALLTKPGDTVLDPFGGKGTTTIETLKLNRIPIYNDLNPFAADIVNGLIAAIRYVISGDTYLSTEHQRIMQHLLSAQEVPKYIEKLNISKDVYEWYDTQTLTEIVSIIRLIQDVQPVQNSTEIKLIRKLAVTSILKFVCSQSGHFTYVTDNCKPANKVYRNAISFYNDYIRRIYDAAEDFVTQFHLMNPEGDLESLLNQVKVITGDARKIDMIKDQSVDLVLTSPPYLCAQDYIKTMRLTNLFFENTHAFNEISKQEIGPRSMRKKDPNVVVNDFYRSMSEVISNIKRVLKEGGFFCLVVGQGKSKVTAGVDTITDLCTMIQTEFHFEKVYQQERKIGNRAIRIGGVNKEHIIIFRKPTGGQ